MESLIGYGSDDENDDLSQHKKQPSSQADVNYEEVQMDLSEESNDSTKQESRRAPSDRYRSRSRDGHSDSKSKEYSEKNSYKKSSDDHKFKHEHGRYSPKYPEGKREDRCRERDRDRTKYEDEKPKSREEKPKDDRNRDYKKDRYRDDKGKFKDERIRESRKVKEEPEKFKERSHDSREGSRDERRPHRTSSRDRHRSRSPRRSDYRSKRSSSRDRTHTGYSKRCDRTSSKMDRLERLGIELNTSNSGFASTSGNLFVNDKEQDKDRFYMPGITGRFTEQIQRRKLLWQKKEPKVETEGSTSRAPETFVGPPQTPQTTKIWQNTTFAQDTDGKVANKFKRLMGIKGNETEAPKPVNDNLKKQEEMFSSMEAQYEVARTATHTMRGVGLGFGSFQR